MPGPVAGMFFYLYLIVDIFSRKIVGWEVHEREAAELAATLIQKAVWSETCVSRPLVLKCSCKLGQRAKVMGCPSCRHRNVPQWFCSKPQKGESIHVRS